MIANSPDFLDPDRPDAVRLEALGGGPQQALALAADHAIRLVVGLTALGGRPLLNMALSGGLVAGLTALRGSPPRSHGAALAACLSPSVAYFFAGIPPSPRNRPRSAHSGASVGFGERPILQHYGSWPPRRLAEVPS
jgi:hypothetical protein